MPNGLFIPSTKTSRSCAPPVFCGSRNTMISPAPVLATNISPFDATVSHRGLLKSFANTFTRKPCGTEGRNPAGGFTLSGPLPADWVAKGGGSFGFCPWVTCPDKISGNQRAIVRGRVPRARMKLASHNEVIDASAFMMRPADVTFHDR